MDEQLLDVYNFLKKHDFGKTLELFKQELDTKPNMPYKSWALEPQKPKTQLTFHTLSQSERKIGYATPNGSRQKSTHHKLMKNIFGKSPELDFAGISSIGNDAKNKKKLSSNLVEQFDITNNSFGHSEDPGVIETKKLEDCPDQESASEDHMPNFSFCDSDTKPKSINRRGTPGSYKKLDTTRSNPKDNAMADSEKKRPSGAETLEHISPFITPAFSDGGKINSNSKILNRQKRYRSIRETAV